MTSRGQYHWKILLLSFPKEREHTISCRAMWRSPRFGQEAERGRGWSRPESLLEISWQMQGRAG